MTFPDPNSDTFVAELEAMNHRLRNPPWWDVIGRMAAWKLRLDKSFVSNDDFARRWVVAMVPIRMIGGLGLWFVTNRLWIGDHAGWWMVLLGLAYGMFIAVWAMAPLGRAQTYESGYLSGSFDGYRDARVIYTREVDDE